MQPADIQDFMQGQEHNVLSLRTHHSIMDGSSLQVLTEDLEAAYTSLHEHKVHDGRCGAFTPMKA